MGFLQHLFFLHNMKKQEIKPVIGVVGLGNFGTLAASILSKHFEVLIYHYRHKEENVKRAERIGAKLIELEEIKNCDIVILTTPISETEDTIKKIAPLMKDGSLLIDTCSVKVGPCDWLVKNTPKTIEILGTHPMFGPTTSKFNFDEQTWNLNGLQIVLCPLRISRKHLQSIEQFLKSLNLKIITTSPKEHDKQNAKTLSFVHFVGRSLLAAGIGPQEIYTPGYSDLLKILPHTTSDNWKLFYDMNNFNPYSDVIREKFRDAGFEIEEKIIKHRQESELDANRELIDIIDTRIMKLLKKRFECSKNIGDYKKERGMKIIDPKREDEIIKNKIKKSDLDGKFIKELYKIIFNESYKSQKK